MLTMHARTRAQQRGIREADLELVTRCGTEAPQGYVMTRKDIRASHVT